MILAFSVICGLTAPAWAAVQEEAAAYTVNGTVYKGYIAYDDAVTEKRPGVLVVPEWWGLNEYARRRARMLAELGYTAMAIDMYGEGKVGETPEEAGALSKAVYADPAAAKARFTAAMDTLKNFSRTDAGRISAIGYCFGGAIVLNMALNGVPLKGVVSFHATLPDPPAGLKAKDVTSGILIAHGGADKFTPDEQLASFKDALTNAGVPYTFNVYEGALHSFTNPDADAVAKKFDLPIGYQAAADAQSWSDMKEFLARL